MMKYTMMLVSVVSLSACMGGGDTSVSQKVTSAGSMSCANSPYMQGASGMPVRCGSQIESPYTFQ